MTYTSREKEKRFLHPPSLAEPEQRAAGQRPQSGVGLTHVVTSLTPSSWCLQGLVWSEPKGRTLLLDPFDHLLLTRWWENFTQLEVRTKRAKCVQTTLNLSVGCSCDAMFVRISSGCRDKCILEGWPDSHHNHGNKLTLQREPVC